MIAAHTERGIEFMSQVQKFMHARSQIEANYARELHKLVKHNLPDGAEPNTPEYVHVDPLHALPMSLHFRCVACAWH